ncbi:phage tail protein [Bacillus mycoides]|uniref:phage tail protein n=1 Tax=Bacillus mycoides TaxID=1405 RepID=UPI003D087C95
MLDIRINNELASKYGVYIVGRPVIPTAEQNVEHIEVEGRHGSLTKKGAFKNVPLKIKFNLLEEENIKPIIRRAKAWLLKGKTLSFTDDDVYRKIKEVKIGDIANEIEEYGEFEVDFTLDPFEYAVDISMELDKPGLIYNPGFESEPKLWIVGDGTLTVTINGVSFQIKYVKGSVVVDSEILEAYLGTESFNNKMVGKFPVFKEGDNYIEWSDNVQFISARPRWRYL